MLNELKKKPCLLASLFSLFLCVKINSSCHINYKDLATNSRIRKFIRNFINNTIDLVVLYDDFYFYPRDKFWSVLSSSSSNGNWLCLELSSSFDPLERYSTGMRVSYYSVYVIK